MNFDPTTLGVCKKMIGGATSNNLIVEISSLGYDTITSAAGVHSRLSSEENEALNKAFEVAYKNTLPVRIRFGSGDGYVDEVVAFPCVYYNPDGSIGGKIFNAMFYLGLLQISSEKGYWVMTKPSVSDWSS